MDFLESDEFARLAIAAFENLTKKLEQSPHKVNRYQGRMTHCRIGTLAELLQLLEGAVVLSLAVHVCRLLILRARLWCSFGVRNDEARSRRGLGVGSVSAVEEDASRGGCFAKEIALGLGGRERLGRLVRSRFWVLQRCLVRLCRKLEGGRKAQPYARFLDSGELVMADPLSASKGWSAT